MKTKNKLYKMAVISALFVIGIIIVLPAQDEEIKIIDKDTVRVNGIEVTDKIKTGQGGTYGMVTVDSKIKNTGTTAKKWQLNPGEGVIDYQIHYGGASIFDGGKNRFYYKGQTENAKKMIDLFGTEHKEPKKYFTKKGEFVLEPKGEYQDSTAAQISLRYNDSREDLYYEGPITFEVRHKYFTKVFIGNVLDGEYLHEKTMVLVDGKDVFKNSGH